MLCDAHARAHLPPLAHTEQPRHSFLTWVQEAVKNTQYDRLKDERGKAPGLLGWWPAK